VPVQGRNAVDVDDDRGELVGDHLCLEQRRTSVASWRSRSSIHLQGKYSPIVYFLCDIGSLCLSLTQKFKIYVLQLRVNT